MMHIFGTHYYTVMEKIQCIIDKINTIWCSVDSGSRDTAVFYSAGARPLRRCT